MLSDPTRCPWARTELSIEYHDREWGVPVHDDRLLFEFLILEGAQAGLSWETILKKRSAYRLAFDNFQIDAVAAYGPAEIQRLLADPGIVRNRLKVHSAVANAQAALAVRREFGSLDAYLWRFVGGRPRSHGWRAMAEVPVFTPEATAMSKDLLRRGFRFVGPTICYSFMQAVGMVNDHLAICFRHGEVSRHR